MREITKKYPPLNNWRPLLIVSLLLIGALAINLDGRREVTTPPIFDAKDGNLAEVRSYWSGMIDQMGPTQAYAKFKENTRSSSSGIQHMSAHIFGALLYEKTGIDGIATCDAEFAFGCYHSFFGGAIADKGNSVVTALDKACIKKFGPLGTGCQHGIGHGLMEYYGTNLEQALADCQPTQKMVLLGCTSGVFMEYNFPTLIGSETATTGQRNLDKKNPDYPCNRIPINFQNSCYFELPQWWYQVYERDDQVMGQLCQDIRNQTNRENCFRGLGNTVGPRTNFDLNKGVETCRIMPSTEGNTLCLSGLSWSWFAEPSKRLVSQKPCQALSLTSRQICLDKADLVKEVF